MLLLDSRLVVPSRTDHLNERFELHRLVRRTLLVGTAQLQGRAAVAVNPALILRNWLVGEWILEF